MYVCMRVGVQRLVILNEKSLGRVRIPIVRYIRANIIGKCMIPSLISHALG